MSTKLCMTCGRLVHKDETECGYCKNDNRISTNLEDLDTDAKIGDYIDIRKISEEPKFVKAMMELHKTDIIEYTAKMSQFKQQNDSNIPKCPTCGSTNLSKLSTTGKAAKVGLFGIFGAGDLGKTYRCNNCGSKF